MRMVGPDASAWRIRPEVGLNATVASASSPPGSVGFASQSGGFGIAAIDAAAARGIGFSSFVAMGDKADLSGNDCLEYWEQDPDTSVLLLSLESFGNPRRFGRIARRITTAKPVVAVKSLAASDVSVDALFEHAGVLRAATVGRCSTSRGCSRASRSRAATASRCSPTRAVPGRVRGRLRGGGAARREHGGPDRGGDRG